MDQDMVVTELLDHDYCLPNTVKTELVEPKIEQFDYAEMPPRDFVEPKIEEPDCFSIPASRNSEDIELEATAYHKIREPKNIGAPSNLELLEPKSEELENPQQFQEPVLLEPKLEAPDCEEDYPEYIKLQMIDNSNDRRTFKRKQTRKCRICSYMVTTEETTSVTQKSRLLILMTGLVVGNRTTLEDARSWISENHSVFLICKAHIEEAVEAILQFLNIRRLDEMKTRSKENTQRLMQVLNDMGETQDFSVFANFLLAFVMKMDSKDAYLGTLSRKLNMDPVDEEPDSDISPEPPKRGRKTKPKRGDSYEKYAHADVVKFILQVELREELWDSQNDNFHQIKVRKMKFGEVENECQKFMSYNARAIGKCAQEMWDQLVNDYAIHLNEASSGSVIGQFPYVEHLQFLSKAKKGRKTEISHCYGSRGHTISERLETPEPSESLETAIIKEIVKSRQLLTSCLESSFARRCASERICKYFEHVTSGMSDVERIVAESKVICFISSLRPRSEGSETTIHSRNLSMEDHRLTPRNNFTNFHNH